MKINPLHGAMSFLNIGSKAVVAREEARTFGDGENGRDQHTRQQADSEEDEEGTPPSAQRMDEAVHEFKLDLQAQASGISASTEGSGPGLRVVVKDASGGVIRQFTGDEFLKLREAVDAKGRGKLINQKL